MSGHQKRKVTYEEKYKRGTVIKKQFLPVLRHTTGQSEVIEAELLAAGHHDDGTEFQVLRVVLRVDDGAEKGGA